MLLKIHQSYRDVVALVDSALLGKTFEEGKRQLAIKEHFFKGEEVSHDAVIRVLRLQMGEDATFNIIGEESIACAIEAGVISEDSVIHVAGIPFALKLV